MVVAVLQECAWPAHHLASLQAAERRWITTSCGLREQHNDCWTSKGTFQSCPRVRWEQNLSDERGKDVIIQESFASKYC